MIKVEKNISAEFCFYSELSSVGHWLFEAAVDARAKSQTPYYKYRVGASVLTYHDGGGRIFKGCNVERCTGTQITHAEQNAIDTMIAELGTKKILEVCVVGGIDSEEINFKRNGIITPPLLERVPAPCGHCLQIIWENCFGDSSIKLLSVTQDGIIAITTIGDAFPMRFGPKDLGVEYK